MGKALTVFDVSWLDQARAETPNDSWVSGVMTYPEEGKLYLQTLRDWFAEFPISSRKDRVELKKRLERYDTRDHLGAVNELVWWEFMRRIHLHAEPVPTSTTPRPDFRVLKPSEFFAEVSTLNVSIQEGEELRKGGVRPDPDKTLRRILLKAANDKKHQICYAFGKQKPCALVLFDYGVWSGLGLDWCSAFADALLGRTHASTKLPDSVSAIVYVVRKVIDGRMAVNRNRSAVYYNPGAKYPLPTGIFSKLREFRSEKTDTKSPRPDCWLWLSE
jgi:hypothetical protein